MRRLRMLVVVIGTSLMAVAQLPAVSAQPATQGVAAAEPLTDGEVRKVDKAARKLTLKHGEIVNLGMDAMTMVFVAPKSVPIDNLKPGDKVHFVADIKDGALTVTHIELVK